MTVAWFLAPYKRQLGAPHPTRYCVVDDFTPQIAANKGDWSEVEILGDAAIVKVRSNDPLDFTAISSKANVLRLPDKIALADLLGDVAAKQKSDINDYLKGLGYGQSEIDSKVPADWSALTLGQLLDAAAARRQRPRYNAQADVFVFDGPIDPVRPISDMDLSVPAVLSAGFDGLLFSGPRFRTPIGYTRRGRPIWPISGGAFPTVTTVLDNFNRAAIGATWTTGSFYGDAAVSINASTTLTGVSFAGGYKNDADYGPDLDDIIDISTANNTAGDQPNLLFRLANGNSPNGYGFCTNVGASTVTGRIIRIDAGSNTQLGATFAITALASGDKIGANATSSTLTAYQFTSGAWTGALASRSDATYALAGKFGNEVQTGLLDNLAGGTIGAGGDGLTHGQLHAMTGITF